jgi:myo-inositol catabolism protein IolC
MNITQKEKEQRVNNLCSQLRKIKTDLLLEVILNKIH